MKPRAKQRKDGPHSTFTTYKKASFLKAYKKLGGVFLAADAAGISHDLAWRWRQDDPEFAAAFLAAKEMDTEQLEAVARVRAVKRSDMLMMFLLNGRRPEVYRQNAKVTHAGGITVKDLLLDDEPPAKAKP